MFVKGYIHILSFDCTFLDSVTSSLHKLSLSKLTGLCQRHLMSEHPEDPLSSLNPLNVNKPWPGWERRATALVCTYIHHIKNTCVCCMPKLLYGVLPHLFLNQNHSTFHLIFFDKVTFDFSCTCYLLHTFKCSSNCSM